MEYRDYAKSEAERIKKELDKEPYDLAFAFITDLHYKYISEMRTTVENIVSVINDVNGSRPLDFVCLGGDNVGNYPPSPEEHIEMMKELAGFFAKLNVPWFVCQGNHDDNSIHGHSDALPENKAASGFEVPDSVSYDALFSHQKDYAGFIPPYDEKALYCAYDVPKKQTRAIFLNGDEVPHIVEENGMLRYAQQWDYGYSGEQLRWLGERALDVNGGTDVIFFEHIPFPDSFASDGDAVNGDALAGITLAFQRGGSYEKTVCSGDFPCDVKVDFGGVKSSVIARISGHTHADAHLYKNGTLDISTAAAGRNASGKAKDENGNDLTKIPFSAFETCFDIFCVNKARGTIRAIRYGVGKNREFNY